MLSVPHMIVVFLVVLVVFGPQKLPELARSFGKLMAEFRKASSDFKNAFEEEMRDLERQARVAELKKQVAEANAAAAAVTQKSAGTVTSDATPPTSALAEAAANSYGAEASTISPVGEAVPRLDGANGESAAVATPEAPAAESAQADGTTTETSPSHDQQQPA